MPIEHVDADQIMNNLINDNIRTQDTQILYPD